MSQGTPANRFIGVEMDSISRAHRAEAIHPEHDIRIVRGFRDTKLPEGRIDAVIGNVPFADVKLDHRGQKFSLHDYFFAKSIDARSPAECWHWSSRHYTLDKQNARHPRVPRPRRPISWERIRLPSDAFKREGNRRSDRDIVFLSQA